MTYYPATENQVRGVKMAAEESLRARQGLVAIGIDLPNAAEPSAFLYLAFADAEAERKFSCSLGIFPSDTAEKALLRSVPIKTSVVRRASHG